MTLIRVSSFTVKKTFVVITRRRVPSLARKIVKNAVLSTAAEILIHHKPPEGSIIIDATVIESLEVCVKILTHL
jgi:hypothetical protein